MIRYSHPMTDSPRDRRRTERLLLTPPLYGTMSGHPVSVHEIGLFGSRIESETPIVGNGRENGGRSQSRIKGSSPPQWCLTNWKESRTERAGQNPLRCSANWKNWTTRPPSKKSPAPAGTATGAGAVSAEDADSERRIYLVSEMEVLDPELFFRVSPACITAVCDAIMARVPQLRAARIVATS